ncbi:MAG: hypothetical protein J6O62_00175 [Bacilli bacterium]|nr:hypothetical protein [Bacilli bacterium]
MTQKELLYMEDAVGHESNIIQILEESINNLEDENLINFMKSELNIHKKIKEYLINKLEEKSNE